MAEWERTAGCRALVGKFNGANKAAATAAVAVAVDDDNNNSRSSKQATVVGNLKMVQRMEIFPFFPSSLWYL